MKRRERPNKSGQTRATGIDLRKRIERTKELLLSGSSRFDTAGQLEVEYKIGESSAYLYIQKAEAEIYEVMNRNREQWLAEHIAIRRQLRNKGYLANDLEFQLECAGDEAKLLGLYAPVKQEITGKDGSPIQHGHSGAITVTHTPSDDIARYLESFVSAADREKASGLPTDGGGKSVDTGSHQTEDDEETS